MIFAWLTKRSKSEKILAALLSLMLLGLGANHAVSAVYLPRQDEIARETARLELAILEMQHLLANADEIRARHEASRSSAERDPATPEHRDVLKALESIADGRVRLSKVYPIAPTGTPAQAHPTLAIQFAGEAGGLEDFLLALANELGGEVSTFQAERSDATGVIQCQATVEIPGSEWHE